LFEREVAASRHSYISAEENVERARQTVTKAEQDVATTKQQKEEADNAYLRAQSSVEEFYNNYNSGGAVFAIEGSNILGGGINFEAVEDDVKDDWYSVNNVHSGIDGLTPQQILAQGFIDASLDKAKLDDFSFLEDDIETFALKYLNQESTNITIGDETFTSLDAAL